MKTNKKHYEAPQVEVFAVAQTEILCASQTHKQMAGNPVFDTDSFFGEQEEQW